MDAGLPWGLYWSPWSNSSQGYGDRVEDHAEDAGGPRSAGWCQGAWVFVNLRIMEKMGLISSTPIDPEKPRNRPRRLYAITEWAGNSSRRRLPCGSGSRSASGVRVWPGPKEVGRLPADFLPMLCFKGWQLEEERRKHMTTIVKKLKALLRFYSRRCCGHRFPEPPSNRVQGYER